MKLTTQEKLSFLGNLATLLTAGIPILEAVNSLLEDTTGNLNKLLTQLRDDLSQGKKIAESLVNFPKVFDKVTISLIKASEEAGTLETTLRDLRAHVQQETEFVDKVRFAMLYPMLIMLVFVGVLGVILFFVVPRISAVFLRLNVQLPLPTKILIWVSQTLINYTGLVILIVVLFLAGGIWLYQKNKSFLVEFIPLFRLIDFTQFSRSMYLLLSSGLPIMTALNLAGDVVVSHKIQKLIKSAREMVLSGHPLSEGLKQGRGLVPVLMLKLVEAGERTGTLDKSLQEISQSLDYEVNNSLKALTAILEPILLVVVGVLVGGMMLAIIAPIYGLIGQVGGR